jgi:UPF0716 protein FxsA
MRLLVLAIVLAFPVIDLWVTAHIARLTGVPMWFLLLSSAAAGLWLMHTERGEFRARTVAAMHGEYPLLSGLVDSGRKVLAAVLFIIPGVLSDLLGLLLLMLPINQRGGFGPGFGPQPAAARAWRPRQTLDAEWRRE